MSFDLVQDEFVFYKDALFTLDIQNEVDKEVAGMAAGEKLFWPSGYTSSVTDLCHGFNSHLFSPMVFYHFVRFVY